MAPRLKSFWPIFAGVVLKTTVKKLAKTAIPRHQLTQCQTHVATEGTRSKLLSYSAVTIDRPQAVPLQLSLPVVYGATVSISSW